MKKTEMMKRYEAETVKQSAVPKFMSGGHALEQKSYPKLGPYDYSTEYIAWLESKAAAYDRIMSGGMKTPKEVANFLGLIVAQDQNKSWCAYIKNPVLAEEAGYWMPTEGSFGILPIESDYSGDWKDSLTLPDKLEVQK